MLLKSKGAGEFKLALYLLICYFNVLLRDMMLVNFVVIGLMSLQKKEKVQCHYALLLQPDTVDALNRMYLQHRY